MKKLLAILAGCLLCQFYLISRTSAYGEKVNLVEGKTSLLKAENQKLELQVTSNLSYTTIFQNQDLIITNATGTPDASWVALRE